jgi:2-dehydro-3-deoxygalactonokinase
MITTMTIAPPIANKPYFIAFDWGTSSLRAYLVSTQGEVLDSRKSAKGILSAQDFQKTTTDVCAQWDTLHGSLPRLASGMIGSKQGWLDAGYIATPTSFEAISKAAVRVPGQVLEQFWIMPGITHRQSLKRAPDVMRGEETQVFGSSLENGIAILPGTHSKWVRVLDGRIVNFKTYMTGETFNLFRQYSLLAKSMPNITESSAESFQIEAFKQGVTSALNNTNDLLHQLFTVRTYGLFAELSGQAQVDYLSGLLIGSEIAAAKQVFIDDTRTQTPLLLLGEPALSKLYQIALTLGDCESVLDNNAVPAAVRGLYGIAKYLLATKFTHPSAE